MTEEQRGLAPRVPPRVRFTDGAIDRWTDQTVTVTTDNVEAWPTELSHYVRLALDIASGHDFRGTVTLTLEPDWDGCAGRWVILELRRRSHGTVTASVKLEAGDDSRSPTRADRACSAFVARGAELVVYPDQPQWGYWSAPASIRDPTGIAIELVTVCLQAFSVYDPTRWFLTMYVGREFEDGTTDDSFPIAQGFVDLRHWSTTSGHRVRPTRAPVGTEPWALLCEAGLHGAHLPPCRNAP